MQQSLSITQVNHEQLPKVLIGIAAVCGVVGGFILFAVNSNILAVEAKCNARFADVSNSIKITREYSVTEDEYNSTAAKLSFLERASNPSAYVPTMIKQLQVLATRDNLVITAIRPVAMPPPVAVAAAADGSGTTPRRATPPAYTTIGISVVTHGAYVNMMRFIVGLTHFPKIVSLANFQMSQADAGGTTGPAIKGPPNVAATLQLMAYVFPADDAVSALPKNVEGPPLPATSRISTISHLEEDHASKPGPSEASLQEQAEQFKLQGSHQSIGTIPANSVNKL